ncbi:MAG: tetratricopeptide repeat protein [Nitrosomonas ureae]
MTNKELLSDWRRLSELADSRKTLLELREWIRSAQEQWLISGKSDSMLLTKILTERAIPFYTTGEQVFFHGELADFLERSIAYRSKTQRQAQIGRLLAFVAMPAGIYANANGNPINSDLIYSQILEPALEKAGFDAFRAEEEQSAGEINPNTLQELLIADLVLVDLSANNPNLWYELGVRHALRCRGVVFVSDSSRTKAFDTFTHRIYNYHIKDGSPDPAHVENDIRAIAELLRAPLEDGAANPVSPIYTLLPDLIQPDWRCLRIGAAGEFWSHIDDWAALIERARKAGRTEDILTLAGETPFTALRIEARLKAGKALLIDRHYHFALEQFEIAVKTAPDNLEAARLRGLCLLRFGHADDARAAFEKLLAEHPDDVETWSLLGRLEKDAWVASWLREGAPPAQMRDDAAYEDALLQRAIDTYSTAFRLSPYNYYVGISAVTLMHLYHDLTGQPRFDHEAISMAGAISWAANNKQLDSDPYWAKVTLAELAVLQGTPSDVISAYKTAITYADKDWFALDSTLSQLRLLAAIGFSPDNVAAGIATFERALARLKPPEKEWLPDKAILFSGHMVDAPGRKEPRFPADKEAIAAAAIARVLDDLGAGDKDLALTQGAAGGDILFAEAALARGMKLQLLLPLTEPDFIEQSILPSSGGDAWRKRYYQLRANPLCLPARIMPYELGPLPRDSQGKETSPFERCNQWLLNSALTRGIVRTCFVCLWNGSGGDGPGGTEHMMKEVKERTGQVSWLDTRVLW